MSKRIPALKVNQWMDIWNEVKYSTINKRRKPEPFFYIFSMNVVDLKRLSAIHRRSGNIPRKNDSGIQRSHNLERSNEIAEYVMGGFPWSVLSKSKRASREYKDLRMPGWLPTAIIANIRGEGTVRSGHRLENQDVVKIENSNGNISLLLPEKFESNDWNPKSKPIEIIDGQHRLLAFEESNDRYFNFEIPVVAFDNLDTTWQAYLFYIINIKPKKINTSLAYDLYPILRIQDWLEKSPEYAHVYRETRAQELTEVLWSYKKSPWFKRINMLGDQKNAPVSQAAFIRTLVNSFVKNWEGVGSRIGGLFGAALDNDSDDVLLWSRTQQAAFLVYMWLKLDEATQNTEAEWAVSIRNLENELLPSTNYALTSRYSLLATDQGVRGVSQIVNDLLYINADSLDLKNWSIKYTGDEIEEKDLIQAIEELKSSQIRQYLESLFGTLSDFDWRTSSFPSLNEEERKNQMVFRGSGGYKELRRQLLKFIIESKNERLVSDAKVVMKRLKYKYA